MPKNTPILLALAAALTALSSALTEECGGSAVAPAEEAPEAPAPVTRGRGRPAAQPPADKPASKLMDEKEIRAITTPLVTGIPNAFPGAGPKIKAILKGMGLAGLKDLDDEEKQAEFLKAIKPLQEELEANSI